jgi:hypothetical protein
MNHVSISGTAELGTRKVNLVVSGEPTDVIEAINDLSKQGWVILWQTDCPEVREELGL